jgi:hydroxymethylpyrimidine pyrophosphatase-like HAD family hydrolase/energy-coupling factor transporter ATP-binding protein EcfA2
MRYLALVSDYDNTLARDGRIADAARNALWRLRESGRRVILLTGRRLDDLLALCDCIDCFDFIVAENGAVLYEPNGRERSLLGPPPPENFVAALARRGVQPLEVGQVIVATHAPHHASVIEAIRESGLELQVIFNLQAVMVLPAGINKATGLKAALRRLGLSPHEVVGVGDAENDHSFLQLSECPVAVANAVDSIKDIAAIVTQGSEGDGVAELIDQIIANDLEHADSRLTRHHIALGNRLDGTTVWVPPYGSNILIAGPSGCGKSTLATGLIERFAEQSYQLCVIDPEGDYITLRTLVTMGNQDHAPGIAEVLAVLRDPYVHVNANLLGIPLTDRPGYFAELLAHLQSMRVRTGRPHWLVVDEAHHLLPQYWGHVPKKLNETVLVTVHPDRLAPSVLAMIDVVIAVGPAAGKTLGEFTSTLGRPPLELAASCAGEGDVVCWFTGGGQDPFPMRVIRGHAERIRHHRKYVEGDVRYNSFFFRGPQGRQNLRAQNLNVFCQMAAGIDEETWLFHLRRHDYSRWIRDVIKNGELAAEIEDIERRNDIENARTRDLVRAAIEARYTLPE